MVRKYIFTGIFFLGLLVNGVPSFAEWLLLEGEPRIRPAEQVLSADSQARTETGPVLRVASYNIQDFFEGDDAQRRTWANARRQARLAARIVDHIEADVLLLQEFETAEMVRLFNNKLNQPFAFGYVTRLGENLGQHHRLNLAVLSRFPLEDVTEIDFTSMTGPGRPTRGLLRFILSLPGELDLVIYNLHLKSNWGDAHRNQSQRHHALRLLRKDFASFKESRGEATPTALLIGGDFNTDPEAPSFAGDDSLRPLDDLIDLWAGRPLAERITVPTRYGVSHLQFPPVTFDRFYVSSHLKDGPWIAGQPHVLYLGVYTNDVRVVAGENEKAASDHYPLFFDLYRSVAP